jgi:hypothetical protein
MLKLDHIARNFNVKQGTAAETSGGLLVVLPPEHVDGFLREFRTRSAFGWHIGEVVAGVERSRNSAVVADGCETVEVC